MDNSNSIMIAGLVENPGAYTAAHLAELSGQIPDVSVLARDREGVAVTLAAVLDNAGASGNASDEAGAPPWR